MRTMINQRLLPLRSFSTSTIKLWANSRPSLSQLPIDLSQEVEHALAKNQAIVALESTLITHGLPPPFSYDLPFECESILRSQGVVPATIAILNGRIKVGLTNSDLARLAEVGFAARKDGGAKLWKVGRRELAACVVKKLDGGTTVSATMAAAHLVGIKIFSTGGIGGVHRGAETSFDISSDLISLSDTPVTVVCAGSKSILDIGLTLEYLEAHAVPVASYGTDNWPAFYTPESGFKAPMRLDGALQVAETIRMASILQLPSSLLLGVPIPEAYHAAGQELQVAVDQAVLESIENGVAKSGKLVTPWLLERVGQLTKGKSILSNMALIKNNVKVGGEIALAYSKLIREGEKSHNPPASTLSSSQSLFIPSLPSLSSLIPAPTPTIISPHSSLVVIGSLAIDLTMTPLSTNSPLQTTAPGTISLSLGGVGSNVAAASKSLGIEDVLLIAPVGDDYFGEMCKVGLGKRGMRSDGLIEMLVEESKEKEGVRTASCGILLDEKGDLVGGVADMDITTWMDSQVVVAKIKSSQPKLVCFDGNLSTKTIAGVLQHCEKENIPTFFEPTSNQKSLRLLTAIESLSSPSTPSPPYPILSFCTPNLQELTTLYSQVSTTEHETYQSGMWFDQINVSSNSLAMRLPTWVVEEGIVPMAVQLLPIIGCLFVKSGSRGVIVIQRVSGVDEVAAWREASKKKGTVVSFSNNLPHEAVVIRYYKGLVVEEIKNVTGAGDNLAAGMLASLVRGLRVTRPDELDLIVEIAQKAAGNALRSKEAVGEHKSLRTLLPSS